MENKTGYLDGEINKLNEERLITEMKVKAAQYSFAETMKKNIGPKMRPTKWQKFRNNIKMFFKNVGKIYG